MFNIGINEENKTTASTDGKSKLEKIKEGRL